MEISILKEIESLRQATVGQLRDRFQQVFGEETRSYHREFLFRRIAWRLQARHEGDLSERARRRAAQLADDADARVRAPRGYTPGYAAEVHRTELGRSIPKRDPRLPIAGTLLTREFKGRVIVVKVLEEGFEFDGDFYRSVTAIATAVTGTRWNGYAFFGLDRTNHGKAQ